MKRARLVYYVVLAVVVVALVAVVAVVWSRGEAAHAHLHTVAPGPSNLALQSPAAAPSPVWRTGDRLAIGSPANAGSVVTWSTHTVGGRDARTGAQTWTYTRTDRSVCTAAQTTNTTIAVYALHGNCDEVSAFDTDTGRRRWTRTLDKDGQPIQGHPSFQLLSYTFFVASKTTIYAIDPVTGLDRWTYFRYGCTISRAVIGTAGALIGQTCTAAVRCKNVKFCATGPQLLLRDGSAGNGDSNDANRDKITWLRRGDAHVPASADGVIGALDPGAGTLEMLAAKDGTLQGSVTLGGTGTDTVPIPLGTTELIWRSGTVYAVEANSDKPVWTAASTSAPTAVAADGSTGSALTPDNARITGVAGGRVVAIDGTNGSVTRQFPVDAPADALAYPLGTGFLVGSPSGAVAYR
jgi:outer membrane protein assembly factor BamB